MDTMNTLNSIMNMIIYSWHGLTGFNKSVNPLFPDDVISRHGRRRALKVVFLTLQVLYDNVLFEQRAAVTELSPDKLFRPLVAPAGCSWALNFAPI